MIEREKENFFLTEMEMEELVNPQSVHQHAIVIKEKRLLVFFFCGMEDDDDGLRINGWKVF